MFSLENDDLLIEISPKGAELQRIYNKHTKLDYLWDGDADFWAKRSPVLFPIVGELKNKTYTYKGQPYQLSRHGFARDMTFEVTEHNEQTIVFTIKDTAETFAVFPFHFEFSIQYTIDSDRVYVVYEVENLGKEDMFFSIGGHPAFRVPVTPDTEFEDYALVFSQVENAGRYPLTDEGLLHTEAVPCLHNAEKLPLKRSLFYQDALVFKNLQSASITVESEKSDHGFIVYFNEFPYLGLWSKRDADFICIEPWCGVADSINATGELEAKEGIVKVEAGEVFEKQWSVEVF